MIGPEMIAVLVFAAGAALAVVVPYILKAREDGSKFDMQYFYGMVVAVVVAALVALPAEVDTSFRGLSLIFLAGMGMQGVANKSVTVLKKRKQ